VNKIEKKEKKRARHGGEWSERRKKGKKERKMLCKNLCLYITNECFVERLTENGLREN
jgi:hypothetical protein